MGRKPCPGGKPCPPGKEPIIPEPEKPLVIPKPGIPGAQYVNPITVTPLSINPDPTIPSDLGSPDKITPRGVNEDWFKTIPTQQTPTPADVAAQAKVAPGTPETANVGQAIRPGFNNLAVPDKTNPAYAQYLKAIAYTDELQSGLVPADVKSQVEQAMAEQGLSAGRFGQMTQAATAKMIGQTSYSLKQQGYVQAIELTKIGENMRQFDTEMTNKVNAFNSTANQDLDKFVVNLNKNVEMNNAQRADQLSQFMADAQLKAEEFNVQNDQTRQLANRQLATQVALANVGVKSENDRAAASNYFQAMNSVMSTTAALDQFFNSQKFQYRGANAELRLKTLDYDETRRLNAKKMETAIAELQFRAEDSNADRASIAADGVRDLQKFAMDIANKQYLYEAHGKNMSDAVFKQIKKTLDELRRTSSLI